MHVSAVKAGRGGRIIFAATIGNALEYYDFTVYGFLTIVIGKLFFPSFDAAGQVLLTVGTFGAGFLMRPLGGIVIGAYADRAGRKNAMVLTIFLMALGCLLIAAAPTYSQVGVAAPVLIVLARSLQGFSAGGEFGASTALLVERAETGSTGFMGSWQFASQGLGVFLAAFTVAGIYLILPSDEIERWGWRVPFLIGLLIAPVGVFMRRHIDDGPVTTGHTCERAQGPILELYRNHARSLVAAMVVTMGGSGASYVVSFYLPTYAIREYGMSPTVALASAAITGALTFLVSPLAGRWCDLAGRKALIVGGRIAVVLLIYPSFALLRASPTPSVLFLIMGLLAIVLTIQAVPCIVILPDLFPARVRASGMSLVYSIGVAVVGGFSPFISAWLIQLSADKLAPAWYLIILGAMSLVALPFLQGRTGEALDTGPSQTRLSDKRAIA